jgi:hypothetical protein
MALKRKREDGEYTARCPKTDRYFSISISRGEPFTVSAGCGYRNGTRGTLAACKRVCEESHAAALAELA